MACSIHLGGDLGADPSASDDHELQGALIIGRVGDRLSGRLLGFGRVRFPFTFMGVLAFGISTWILVYLAGHKGLDATSQAMATGTAVLCFGFGTYVMIRRVRRGPQR